MNKRIAKSSSLKLSSLKATASNRNNDEVIDLSSYSLENLYKIIENYYGLLAMFREQELYDPLKIVESTFRKRTKHRKFMMQILQEILKRVSAAPAYSPMKQHIPFRNEENLNFATSESYI